MDMDVGLQFFFVVLKFINVEGGIGIGGCFDFFVRFLWGSGFGGSW